MPKNLWSDTEIKILQEYYPKCTLRELLILLPRQNNYSIYSKATQLGIRKSPEALSKIRATFTSRHHKEKTKQKIREANLGRKFSQESLLKMSQAHKGNKGMPGDANPAKRPEVRAKISRAKKGKKMPEEFRYQLKEVMKGEGNPFYGRHHSETTRTLISEKRKGKHNSPETEFTSERAKEIWTPEAREEKRAVTKALWQSKEYVEKTIASLIKSLAKRPNELEQKVIKVLNTNFPNEWKYTGDGKVMLGKLIPDFININGKKQVIEVFGEYWHTGERIKNRIDRTEKGRIKAYQKLGYNCLVLWDKDIEDKQKVISLVKNFMEV